MGNADSKVAAEKGAPPESAVNKIKFDGETGNAINEEKKEADSTRKSKSKMARTPRQKGGRMQHEEGSTVVSNQIAEEQVHVNIAMADLMAYLQVVANNSNHLPLTRRDDPELDRTVSTLTSEDYARKSAAFIPADVRVIGGTFTRYGRVWDLPTTEVCAGMQRSSQRAPLTFGNHAQTNPLHLPFYTGIQCLRWSTRTRSVIWRSLCELNVKGSV